MRQPLYEDDDLSVFFAIDEETDEAFVELESSPDGPDLSLEDDVIVAVGGEISSVSSDSPREATAPLGKWGDLEKEGLELMIRVGEWFESWELELG